MPSTLNGNWQDDTIVGTGDDELINGASGDDSLVGDAGDDTLKGASGKDTLEGGDGEDQLDGGSQDDQLDGGSGADTLTGKSGDDIMSGGDGNDSLDGGSGSDTQFGGAGDDTIIAEGSDYADGGAGDDSIEMGEYYGGNDTIAFDPGGGNDTAMGWSPVDDYIHIGDVDPADVTLTATADPQIWILTFDGYPDDSLTLDFTYYWDSSVTEDEILSRIVNNEDEARPENPYGVVCFTEGAQIETPGGPCAVEDLKAGDLVLTRDSGAQPILLALYTDFTQAELLREENLRPVRIRKNAFGPDMPRRPMLVSPQHGMLAHNLDNKAEYLIRAKHIATELELAHFAGARRAGVRYYHLVLAEHHLIKSDGLWTETLYTGPEALKSDPVLRRAIRNNILPVSPTRVRPLLRRRDLRNGINLKLGPAGHRALPKAV